MRQCVSEVEAAACRKGRTRNLAAVHLAAIAAFKFATLAAGAALAAALEIAALDFGAFRYRYFLLCFYAFAALELASKIATRNRAAAADTGVKMLHRVEMLRNRVSENGGRFGHFRRK